MPQIAVASPLLIPLKTYVSENDALENPYRWVHTCLPIAYTHSSSFAAVTPTEAKLKTCRSSPSSRLGEDGSSWQECGTLEKARPLSSFREPPLQQLHCVPGHKTGEDGKRAGPPGPTWSWVREETAFLSDCLQLCPAFFYKFLWSGYQARAFPKWKYTDSRVWNL